MNYPVIGETLYLGQTVECSGTDRSYDGSVKAKVVDAAGRIGYVPVEWLDRFEADEIKVAGDGSAGVKKED